MTAVLLPGAALRAPLTPTLVLLSILVLLMASRSYSQPTYPIHFNIPMTTYGPTFTHPAMVAYLNSTYYNSALPALNSSWPVIKMAGVVTQQGQYNTYAALFPQIYSFMVDMVNAKGGVSVDGVPHLISITWASDDSSMWVLEYLYTQWMNDPSYTLFLLPVQDAQLVALNSVIVNSNRTFFNFLASDKADFTAHYPYIWTLLTTRDQIPAQVMAQLNLRAQQYHNDLNNQLVQPSYAGETTSQWGIQTVCLYTHNDAIQNLTAAGVRHWVNVTNQARLAAGATHSDLIMIVQDVFWNIDPTAVQQDLYTSTFNLCPDHTDVLMVCGQTSLADATAIGAALAATQLRPKAAFSSDTLPSYSSTNPQLANQWPGWISYGSYPSQPATLPSPTFSTLTQFKRDWSTYFNASISSLSNTIQLYPSALDIIKGVLTTTATTSAMDMRSAFLGLRGNTYIRTVQFNNLTGTNDGSLTTVGQLAQQAGLVAYTNISQIIYPYNWPWSLLQVGDALNMTQNSTNVIIGWVLVMLGCWVAQIIVEQAVFVRRRGGWYKLWLGLVATSLGGAGVWCSQWTMSSAINLTKPSDGTSLPISFSFDVAILALLPALILTWCGLMVLMRDVEDNSSEVVNAKHSAAHAARQINKEQRAEKRKRAALSNKAHFFHLKDCMSRNVLLGALLIAIAVSVTRVSLWYNWSVQASVVSSAAGWIVTVIVNVLLLLPALLMYFHALKWRTAAVFMLAGAVMIDWQVHVYTMTFKYALNVLVTPTALYTLLLSSTAVQLITGIITAVTCFGFIGLQFSRMQLSRNGLSVLVASLENVINKQKAALRDEQQSLFYAYIQSDELVRIIEAINIVRPIPKEYAWALASCSNTSTFRQQMEQAASSHFAPASTLTSPLLSSERLIPSVPHHVSITGSPVLSSTTTRGSALSIGSGAAVTAGKSSAIIALIQPKSDSVDDDGPSNDDQDNSSPAAAGGRLASPTVSLLSSANTSSVAVSVSGSTSRQGWMEDGSNAVVDESGQPPRRRSIAPSSRATPQVGLVSATSPTGLRRSISGAEPAGLGSAKTSAAEKGEEPEPSKTSESINSLSVSAQVSHVDHRSRCKQFELDLVTLLNQQAQHATVAALEQPHLADGARLSVSVTSINGKGKGPSAEDLEFTMGAAAKSKPTLVELLSHPVCVEVLKDELSRIHSVENLVFYLHAVRYRQLQNAKARRVVGQQLYDTFIAENAEQQINISTRQRDTIQAQLKKRGDDAATPQLFREAEREVALLMETNIMKTFSGTSAYRVCALVLSDIDINKATGKWAEQKRGVQSDDGWGDNRMSLLASKHSSQGSRKLEAELSAAPSSITKSSVQQT